MGFTGVIPESIEVAFRLDEGSAPADSWDELERPAQAQIAVTGRTTEGATFTYTMNSDGLDFATILREIVAAGGGTIST